MIDLKLQNRTGFTLLELLIYMSVLSIVILLVSGSFISINQGRGRSTAKSDVNSAMRFALEQIHQDIQMSTGVTTPRYGKLMTCDVNNTSACLVAVIGPDTITYDVNSNHLRRKVNSGAATQITPDTINITSLTVEYFGNNNIPAVTMQPSFQVSMTAAYNSTSADYQYSETKQATFAPVLVYAASVRGGGSAGGSTGGGCFLDPILGTLICL